MDVNHGRRIPGGSSPAARTFQERGEFVAIDVTKQNFLEESSDFLKRLSCASFVAIDEEMTGIMIPGGAPKPVKDETPSSRYNSVRKVSFCMRKVHPCQMPFCCFDSLELFSN